MPAKQTTAKKKPGVKNAPAKKATAKRASGNKATATGASVDSYLEAIPSDTRRADCRALTTLMSKATGEPPAMWGSAIVGFGSYHYKYDSGREGDACAVGFSSRANNIAIYIAGDFPQRDALLVRLGKHSTAKACLYIDRLSDVNTDVLGELVARSATARKKNHSA